MKDQDPTVRSQELGDALRALREESDFSLEEAGRLINASASKLSRIETGKRSAPCEDVAALLAVYRVAGAERDRLLALAREVDRRGWWQRNHPDFAQRQHTLMSLESKADSIIDFEPIVVPGLLQTGEFLSESDMVPEPDVESRMITRLRRHLVLLRPHPPRLLALIDELALHRSVGAVAVSRRQLEHLVECADHQHITIRIVPNRSAHAGTIGAFTLIQQSKGPSVAVVEQATSSLFIEERHEVAVYELIVRKLLDISLDERESVSVIADLAHALEERE